MHSISDAVTRSIVDFAFAIANRAPDSARATALTNRVVDVLACAIAAAREPEVGHVARAILAPAGAGHCDALLNGRAPLAEAVFLNSFMVRYLDWNDTYIGKNGGHPSDVIAGALTVGHHAKKNGDAVLRAIAAGQHVMLDLCDAADAFGRGWDHATYIGLASTVTMGLLLDLTPRQLAHAISMTAVSNNMLISRSGKIATWKGLAAPAAARTALQSCLMARAGVTGPDPVFEGDHGFMKHISGPLAPEFNPARERAGDTHLKMFPAVYHAQAPIEMALRLREKLVAEFGEDAFASCIDRVHITTYAFAIKWAADGATKWKPENRETADHSLPFMTAMALALGNVDHEGLEAAIHNERVLDLCAKVSVSTDDAMSAQWPRLSPARLFIRAAGRGFTEEGPAHTGHVTRPMPPEMVDAKLVGAATHALGAPRARAWAERARSITDLPTVEGLLAP